MKRSFVHATVVTPGKRLENATIITDGETILEVGTALPPQGVAIDAHGALAVPGFIDIHTHGACGVDCTDDNPQAIEVVAKAKQEEGCALFAPTTLTLAREQLADTMRRVAAYGNDYAHVLGVHLEGPYINPSCCGAQNPAFVRGCDAGEIAALKALAPIAQVTYAAETDTDGSFAAALREMGITPSCGHSKATYAQFKKSYDSGLRHLTHFCNQMTPLHHRDIGLVGAGLLHDDVNLELICDKIHLSPEMIQLVFARKPVGHILLITDSMRASHLPDGPSSLGGLEVIVKDGQARLASNGALAGSVLKMNLALKNVRDVTGLPLEQIIQTTSWNQACEAGLSNRFGKIEPGFADAIALLDPETFAVVRQPWR